MAGHGDSPGVLELVSVQSLCAVIPERADYFLFSHTQSLVKSCKLPFGETWEKG
jgi:hypothetical protein